MYKHSTTHRTLSRRLAALLAALALLAAMALPVYAEALDGTTGTAQAEIGDTISDGTVTTENGSTTSEGKEAAKDSTANADGNNASKNEDTNDNASPSTTGDSNTTAGNTVNDPPITSTPRQTRLPRMTLSTLWMRMRMPSKTASPGPPMTLKKVTSLKCWLHRQVIAALKFILQYQPNLQLTTTLA